MRSLDQLLFQNYIRHVLFRSTEGSLSPEPSQPYCSALGLVLGMTQAQRDIPPEGGILPCRF
jgi:hypothetical protein